MHAVRRQAHAELYMGLVETGVGLLPAGGGCKEMTLRALDAAALSATQSRRLGGVRGRPAPEFRNHRHGQGFHLRAGGAALGICRTRDRVTMNRERLLTDAKALALRLADAGYAPPCRAPISRRRAKICWPRSSSAFISCARESSSAITM